MEEKLKLTKDAVEKILGILVELPPDMYAPAVMCLKMVLLGPGPVGALAGMLGGPFAPPPFPFKGRF